MFCLIYSCWLPTMIQLLSIYILTYARNTIYLILIISLFKAELVPPFSHAVNGLAQMKKKNTCLNLMPICLVILQNSAHTYWLVCYQ